jgi:hypothetical protein
MKIWVAHAEPKCKLFGWLALHGKCRRGERADAMGWLKLEPNGR